MSNHFEAKAREILEKIDRDRFRSDIHQSQARDEHIGAIANALAEATMCEVIEAAILASEEREREACAKIARRSPRMRSDMLACLVSRRRI